MRRRVIIVLLLFFGAKESVFALGWKFYIVKRGDSLEAIAKQYDVSVEKLALWNNISRVNYIHVGQKIKILKETAFVASSPADDHPDFVRPVSRLSILRRFSTSGETPFYGILLKTSLGGPVKAAESGIVVKVGPVRGYGECIFLDHGGGWLSMYSHLTDIKVKPGNKIRKEALIGETSGGKFFFTISRDGTPLNPLDYL